MIHHGIDHERFRPGDEPREDFLLYPARRWPHKNHARLFEAFSRVRAARLRGYGSCSREASGVGYALPDGVEALGIVPGEELASLYRRASALVFPSLYEGSGSRRSREAMACALPGRRAPNAASLPEVCGDAARLFPPEDPAAIAAAVEEVLEQPSPWRERGLARAAGFTWERSARAHEAVYRELL